MSPEALFTLCNQLILIPWLLLLLAPRWVWTRRIVFFIWIPVLLGIAYIYAMSHAFPFPEGAGFGSLDAVLNAFAVPWLALAGWIHYLVFDLFVGAWIVRDAQRSRISHLAIVPCLILTFLAGPVGLLLYALLRYTLNRRLDFSEVV